MSSFILRNHFSEVSRYSAKPSLGADSLQVYTSRAPVTREFHCVGIWPPRSLYYKKAENKNKNLPRSVA